MKKVLLLSLSLVMGLCAFAQETVVKSLPTPVKAKLEKQSLGNDVVVGTANFEVRGTQSVVVNEGNEYYDAEAMMTTYDLQSNSVVSNRMYQLSDGSVGVVATMSRSEYDAEFLDRGTGYNFADRGKVGKWGGISGVRVEAKANGVDVRTGWPTIAPYGKEGEILVNHGHEDGLAYYIREKAGEGEWDGPHAIPNPKDIDEVVKGQGNTLSWARIVTTGENNDVLHVFANASGDTNMASYYLRTENLKDVNAWEIGFSPLEMDTLHINCYAADDYSVSANGDKIAVLYCAGFHIDVMLYESEDAGKTWESRVVWESPVDVDAWYVSEDDGGDYTLDELYAPTQGSVAIGADGVSHVVLGASLYDIKPGGYYSLYYGLTCDGVVYWNDTTCWETKVVEVLDSLKVKDSTEVVEYEIDTAYYVYDTLNIDTLYVDSLVLDYDTVAVDSLIIIAIDTITVDSIVIDTLAFDTLVIDTLKVDSIVIDTLAVDSIFVVDTLDVDTVVVYEYDIDSLLHKVYDSTTVDTTYYTYVYDSIFRNDTVGVPSPIRSPEDDDLRNAMRLWWPDPEDTTMMYVNPTNFCAITPVHPEQGFAGFDYKMLYTGSTDQAGDYLMAFGCIAYPSIAVDPAGNLAVAFSAPEVTRFYNNAYYMRSLYVNYKPIDSLYWGQMPILQSTNLYADYIHSNDECTYVSAVSTPINENEFWFSCLSDDTPGFYSGNTTSQANITTSVVNVFKYSPVAALEDESEEIGIEETMDAVYNIYPNPASEFICVSSSMDANATVVFTNIAGQTVKVVNTNLTTGDNTIVVNDLTSGVYFCTVTANGYSHTSKVVIK